MGDCGWLIHSELPYTGLLNLRYAYDDIDLSDVPQFLIMCVYRCLDKGRILFDIFYVCKVWWLTTW